jgi:hypothetical protein
MISSPKQKRFEVISDIHENKEPLFTSLHIQHNVEHLFDDAICK